MSNDIEDRKTRMRALAVSSPGFATLRQLMVREATREHIEARTMPGYRVLAKVTGILQKHQYRQSKRPARIQHPVLAANVDVNVLTRRRPSTVMRRGSERLIETMDPQTGPHFNGAVDDGQSSSPPVDGLDRARYNAVVRAVQAQCSLMGLDEIRTASVMDYVAANRRRVAEALGSIYAQKKALHDREVLLRDRSRVGPHQHLFMDAVTTEDKRRAAFPSALVYDSRLIRCAGGHESFERNPSPALLRSPSRSPTPLIDRPMLGEALDARRRGLSEAQLRGLDILDQGMRLLPVLQRYAVPHTGLHSSEEIKPDTDALVSPSNLGSFLVRRAEEPRSVRVPPRGSDDSVCATMRFEFDSNTIAGLLNNDGALIVAMSKVLDNEVGSIHQLPLTTHADSRLRKAVASRQAAIVPRTLSGVSAEGVRRTEAARAVDSPFPPVCEADIAVLKAALCEREVKHSDAMVEYGFSVGLQLTSLARESFAKVDCIPAGIVGDALRALPLSVLTELQWLWETQPSGDQRLVADGKPLDSLLWVDFEPSCLICAASQTGKHGSSAAAQNATLADVRASWRALQRVSNLKANTSLREAIVERDVLRSQATTEATGTLVSSVVREAQEHGVQWSLSRRGGGTVVPRSEQRRHRLTPIWEGPVQEMHAEEERVATMELFWQRLGVFLRSVMLPANADQESVIEQLRLVLLRERGVASTTLFRWLASVGPSAVEGRDMAKLVFWVAVELNVPPSAIVAWRKLPPQRLAGWCSMGTDKQ